MMRSLRNAALVLVLASGGCSDRTAEAFTSFVRDSAGVAMFDAPLDTTRAERWTVGEPELVVGGMEGDTANLFDELRSGVLLDDGGFVVANAGADQVLFYAADGTRTRAMGRSGQGPGEFGFIDFVQRARDSIWVNDWSNQRITVLDLQGMIGREIPIEAPSRAGNVRALSVFENGRVLAWGTGVRDGMPQPGPVREMMDLMTLPAVDSTHVLGRFGFGQAYWMPMGDGMTAAEVPFGSSGTATGHGTGWLYTPGDRYRVEAYDTVGALRAVFTHPAEPPPVTDADVERYFAVFREEMGGEPSQVETSVREIPRPERMPAYDEVLSDHDGNVWARPYIGEGAEGCWHVYGRAGTTFAQLCFPERFSLLDVAGDVALGVLRDELDVERIARYRIVRPTPTSSGR